MPLCPPQAVYPGLHCSVWSPGVQHSRNSGSLGSDISYQPDSHADAVSEGFRVQTRSWKKRSTKVCFFSIQYHVLTAKSRGIISWKQAVLGSSTDTQKWLIFKYSAKISFAQTFHGVRPSTSAKYFQRNCDTRATNLHTIKARLPQFTIPCVVK